MRADIKERWVAALKSGEYTQGRSHLHSGAEYDSDGTEKYCCLGVLCDLAVKEGAISPPVKVLELYAYDDEGGVLPESVQDWAGLDSARGSYIKAGLTGALTTQWLTEDNDNGKNFTEIADIIEANF